MKQKNIIIIAVIVILAIAGVASYMNMNKTSPESMETSDQNETIGSSQTSKGSIQSLLSSGKDVTCTITYPDQTGSGIVYVSGTNFRGDFSVKSGDKEMMSHMIKTGDVSYMWADGSKEGTMFKMSSVKPTAAPSAQTQGADLNKQVDLKCSPGAGDSAAFNPPSDVKFTDMSTMMENMQKQMGANGSSAPKMDPSICNQIADASAKAQCLKALGN